MNALPTNISSIVRMAAIGCALTLAMSAAAAQTLDRKTDTAPSGSVRGSNSYSLTASKGHMIRAVDVRVDGEWIRDLRFLWRGHTGGTTYFTSPVRNTAKGSWKRLSIPESDYLHEVVIGWDSNSSNSRYLRSITLNTRRGMSLFVGATNAGHKTTLGSRGWEVVGFHGKWGFNGHRWGITSMGLYSRPVGVYSSTPLPSLGSTVSPWQSSIAQSRHLHKIKFYFRNNVLDGVGLDHLALFGGGHEGFDLDLGGFFTDLIHGILPQPH